MAYPYQVNFTISNAGPAIFAPITYYASGTPVDLTTANAIGTFTDPNTLLDILTITNGNGIILGGTAGTIGISLSALQAAQLPPGNYEFILQLDLG